MCGTEEQFFGVLAFWRGEMKEFTISTFTKMISFMDEDNNYDFETFSESLLDLQDNLTDSDIDEILNFLTDQYGIEHDRDVCNMTTSEIEGLVDYINNI